MPPTNFILAIRRQMIIELKSKVSITQTLPCEPGSARMVSWALRFPAMFPGRVPCPHPQVPRPGPPPRPANSDPAATDIYTHREFAPRCSAPSDRPSPKAEVGELQVPQQRAPNAPHSGGRSQSLLGDPGLGARGPAPERRQAPRRLQLSRRRRPQTQTPSAPGRLPLPSPRCPIPPWPRGTPQATLRPGPALGAPRPHLLRVLCPSVPTGPTRPPQGPPPHTRPPQRRQPRDTASRRPDAALSQCRWGQRAPGLGRPASRPSEPLPGAGPVVGRPPCPAPRAPEALTVSPSRGQACTRRSQDLPPAPRRPETPPSLSPGLAGTAAHGSPHRGYF